MTATASTDVNKRQEVRREDILDCLYEGFDHVDTVPLMRDFVRYGAEFKVNGGFVVKDYDGFIYWCDPSDNCFYCISEDGFMIHDRHIEPYKDEWYEIFEPIRNAYDYEAIVPILNEIATKIVEELIKETLNTVNKRSKRIGAMLLKKGDNVVIAAIGDMEDDTALEHAMAVDGEEGFTVSLRCLDGLLDDETFDAKSAVQQFRISFVDCIPDDCKPVVDKAIIGVCYRSHTSAELMELVTKTKDKDIRGYWPRQGYDEGKPCIVWHRPASAVIKVKSGIEGGRKWRYFLLGMDEGSYFGCELCKAVSTVAEAYEVLKPKEVIEAEAAGLVCLRQGEWFAVPVELECDEKEFPWDEIIAWGESNTYDYEDGAIGFNLPLEGNHWADKNQNRHTVLGDWFATCHGEIFVKNCVVHHSGEDEHEPLILKGDQWYQFFRNAALKSRTVEGLVD